MTSLSKKNEIYSILPEYYIVFMEFHGWNVLQFSSGWNIFDYQQIEDYTTNNICSIGSQVIYRPNIYSNTMTLILYCIDGKMYIRSSHSQTVQTEVSYDDFLGLLNGTKSYVPPPPI